MGKNRKRYFLIKRLKKMNSWLIANILAIFILSLMSIYSSTIPKGPSFFQKELLWFFISTIVFIGFSLLDYHKYMKYDRYVYLFNVLDRKSTRLNSSHANISYAVFCLKKKK